MGGSDSPEGVLGPLKKLRKDAGVLIGLGNFDRFVQFIALAAALQVAAKWMLADREGTAHTLRALVDGASLLFFGLGLVYVAIGFVISPNAAASDRRMVLDGLFSGVLAGVCAAVIGGIPYYAFNIQMCPTSDNVVKFMRLLPNCLLLGSVMGVLFGRYPPFARAVPPAPRRGRAAGVAVDETRVGDFVTAVVSLGLLLAFLVWFDNAPTSLLGAEIAGNKQGNILCWQFVCLVGVFAVAYLAITQWKAGWNADAATPAPARLCGAVSRGLLVVGGSGLVLGLLFGNADIDVSDRSGAADACSHAYWANTTYLTAAFRILALAVWLTAVLYVGFRRSTPGVDGVVGRVCRRG